MNSSTAPSLRSTSMSLPSLSLKGKVLNTQIYPDVPTSLNFQGLHGDRWGEGTWIRVLSCFCSSVWKSFFLFTIYDQHSPIIIEAVHLLPYSISRLQRLR